MPPTPQISGPRDLDVPVSAVYIKGVCAGFVRFKLSRPLAREATWHCWTLFLMSNCGLDLSPFVENVTFVIHRDFSSYVRSVYEPPYETTVIGQSGFEAFIHIVYRDSKMAASIISVNIIVDSEDYTVRYYPDMLVFVNPRFWFSRLLDVERICPKRSSVLHHLNVQQFLRQQNAEGRVPYIFDSTRDRTPPSDEHRGSNSNTDGLQTYEGLPRLGTARYRVDNLQTEFVYPHQSESVGLYLVNSAANNAHKNSIEATAGYLAGIFSDAHPKASDHR